MAKYDTTIRQFYPKKGIGQCFDHLTLHLNPVRLRDGLAHRKVKIQAKKYRASIPFQLLGTTRVYNMVLYSTFGLGSTP